MNIKANTNIFCILGFHHKQKDALYTHFLQLAGLPPPTLINFGDFERYLHIGSFLMHVYTFKVFHCIYVA